MVTDESPKILQDPLVNHHGQEKEQKCGFDSSRNKWIIRSGSLLPGAQEEARRNGVEMDTNKDKSSSCDVSVTCDGVLYFL